MFQFSGILWCFSKRDSRIMSELPILLGDSILKRLYKRNPNLYHPLSATLCVSGQRTQELTGVVTENRQLLKGKKVIVLIGTNDILKGTSFDSLRVLYRSLIRLLRRLSCTIVLCEVLPIPLLKGGRGSLLLSQLNQYIRSFEPSGIQVLHIYDAFCDGESVRLSLFCKSMGNGKRRRVDLIHPNFSGLDVLLTLLEG